MPIYMDGKVYENQAHLEAAFSPMLKDMGVDVKPLPPDDVKGDEQMVQTPNQVDTNKQLQQQDDAVLGGTEISNRIYVGRTPSTMPLESPTEPADAFKLGEAIPVGVDWSRLNKPFGELKGTAPEDTPVVFETKNGIRITEGDIQRGMDIAMSAGPGIIAGPKSNIANGVERWWKGGDNKFRYEISDEGMKLHDRDWKFGETGKLSDYIDHPELFKAYPELKDVNFRVMQKDEPWIGGFTGETNTLAINPARIRSGDEGILDVVAHELQHWVQRKEGFDFGSNPNHALREAVIRLAGRIERTPEGPRKQELMNLLDDIRNNKDKFGEYMYERAPGEVEANAVMARRKLSDQQRRLFPVEEFNKLMEGEPNTLSGGRYRPEFRYPKEDYILNRNVSAAAEVKSGELPKGYYDKVPQERRLWRSGTEPSHPGYRWEVYDPQTGKTMRKDIMSRTGASRTQDNLDNKYGGYKYRVRMVKADKLTEAEQKFLKENDIDVKPPE